MAVQVKVIRNWKKYFEDCSKRYLLGRKTPYQSSSENAKGRHDRTVEECY